jgi:hypothetical protein
VLPEGVSGRFRITARAGDATRSDEVNIIGNEASIATPTSEPTATPTQVAPTETPTPVPATETPTPTPTTVAALLTTPGEPALRITLSDALQLLGAFVGLLLTAGVAYWLAMHYLETRKKRLKLLLWALIGSLIVYNYVTLQLPGTAWMTVLNGWEGFLAIVLGGLVGIGLFLWHYRPNWTADSAA